MSKFSIAVARRSANMTQEVFAFQMGISSKSLSRIECGKNNSINLFLAMLERLDMEIVPKDTEDQLAKPSKAIKTIEDLPETAIKLGWDRNSTTYSHEDLLYVFDKAGDLISTRYVDVANKLDHN